MTPIGDQYQMRMRIRRPDGQTGPELLLSMTSFTGPNESGVWSHGTDETGYITFESTLDIQTQAGSIGFKHNGFTGEEATAVLPSLEFLGDLHGPNMIQVAQKYGPFNDFQPAPDGQAMIPHSVVNYIRALATIQTRTPTPIVIPDLDTLTSEDVREVAEAAALIDGKTVIKHWEAMTVANDPEKNIDTSLPYQIAIPDPLIITIGGQEFTLGAVEMILIAATFHIEGDTIRAVPVPGNNTMHLVFHPDWPLPDPTTRSLRANRLPPADQPSDSAN